MNLKSVSLLAALALVGAVSTTVEPASAHVSVYPSLSATGSSTAALTAGQSGYLNFRIGHGCTDETGTPNPITGLSMSGTVWGTHSFAVEVPVLAQGTGSTIPKAEYVPGWRSSVTKNTETNTYLVKWTAISSDFDVPDAPEGESGAKQYAEFGVSVKWASAALGDVYFKAYQTCNVDMSTKPAGISANKMTFKHNRTGAIATVNVGAAKAGQSVTFYGENGYLRTVQVNPAGKASVWISHRSYLAIKNQSKLLALKSNTEEVLAFVGGSTASRQIFIDWDVTDGSGADTVLDDTEHNTAPKVTVLAAS